MEPAAIIHELTHFQGLPREALKAAAERRAELGPMLINEIEAYLSLPADQRAAPTPVFYAFHLLGDWKDKSAYRLLSRFLRCPPDELEAQIGDGLVETAHRVIASVFDGDPEPIFEIILDPLAEEFVRSRMCEALSMLVLRGEVDREAVARFLRDCFMNLQPQSECYVWTGWQSAIAMLGLRELRGLVKKAFDRGFIDPNGLAHNLKVVGSNPTPATKFYALSNAYAPPSGAAFAFLPPVEALWKQEGRCPPLPTKSFISLRKYPCTIRTDTFGCCSLNQSNAGPSATLVSAATTPTTIRPWRPVWYGWTDPSARSRALNISIHCL
jgi:hypothetical protein